MTTQLQFPMQPLVHVPVDPHEIVHRHSPHWKPQLFGVPQTAEMFGIPLVPKIPSLKLPSLDGLGQSALDLGTFAARSAAQTVSILATLSILPAAAGPVGAAIAGLIAVGSAIAGIFSGCGQTCIIASQDANKVGDFLTQNLQHYLSAPIHYKSLQAAALNNFDFAWKALVQACSDPSLGSAGQRCISDRQQGACKWTSSPGGWQQVNGKWTYIYPGPAGSGSACWNYFVGMRDPIANDPTVVPDPPTTGTGGPTATSGGGGANAGVNLQQLLPLLLIVGGVLVVMVVL